MAGLTLDAGALIACEKRTKRFTVILAMAKDENATLTVPAAVLAQVWRGNSPLVARLIQGCIVEPLGEQRAKDIGALLAKVRDAADIVDATVVLGAALRGDAVVTSDAGDIRRLISATGATVPVLEV